MLSQNIASGKHLFAVPTRWLHCHANVVNALIWLFPYLTMLRQKKFLLPTVIFASNRHTPAVTCSDLQCFSNFHSGVAHLCQQLGQTQPVTMQYLRLQAEHLQHWGIKMVGMQKTEKTMTELQIDLNMSFEFDRITEKGAQLHPVSGPGCVCTPEFGLHVVCCWCCLSCRPCECSLWHVVCIEAFIIHQQVAFALGFIQISAGAAVHRIIQEHA